MTIQLAPRLLTIILGQRGMASTNLGYSRCAVAHFRRKAREHGNVALIRRDRADAVERKQVGAIQPLLKC
jgi:hypothetical protein